jgi:hypothetical protein
MKMDRGAVMDLKELVDALHDYYEESIFVTDG